MGHVGSLDEAFFREVPGSYKGGRGSDCHDAAHTSARAVTPR